MTAKSLALALILKNMSLALALALVMNIKYHAAVLVNTTDENTSNENEITQNSTTFHRKRLFGICIKS